MDFLAYYLHTTAYWLHIYCIYKQISCIFLAYFLHIWLIQSIYLHIVFTYFTYICIFFAYFFHMTAYFMHIKCISCIFSAYLCRSIPASPVAGCSCTILASPIAKRFLCTLHCLQFHAHVPGHGDPWVQPWPARPAPPPHRATACPAPPQQQQPPLQPKVCPYSPCLGTESLIVQEFWTRPASSSSSGRSSFFHSCSPVLLSQPLFTGDSLWALVAPVFCLGFRSPGFLLGLSQSGVGLSIFESMKIHSIWLISIVNSWQYLFSIACRGKTPAYLCKQQRRQHQKYLLHNYGQTKAIVELPSPQTAEEQDEYSGSDTKSSSSQALTSVACSHFQLSKLQAEKRNV